MLLRWIRLPVYAQFMKTQIYVEKNHIWLATSKVPTARFSVDDFNGNGLLFLPGISIVSLESGSASSPRHWPFHGSLCNPSHYYSFSMVLTAFVHYIYPRIAPTNSIMASLIPLQKMTCSVTYQKQDLPRTKNDSMQTIESCSLGLEWKARCYLDSTRMLFSPPFKSYLTVHDVFSDELPIAK